MQEYNEELNLDEFIDAVSRLYETLNHPDRNLILNYSDFPRKNSSQTSALPFKVWFAFYFQPKINEKSRRLALNSRWGRINLPERQSIQLNIAKQRVVEQLKENNLKEIEDCTFHPKLYYSKYDHPSYGS